VEIRHWYSLMGWTPPTASMCQSGGVETHFKESVHGTG
jgi:hypothetical protein